MTQVLGELGHLLRLPSVVTNRHSYLQGEEMTNGGPLLVLKSATDLCYRDFGKFFFLLKRNLFYELSVRGLCLCFSA